jgi:hypothetical protein
MPAPRAERAAFAAGRRPSPRAGRRTPRCRDVANVTTRICFGLASGTLSLPDEAIDRQIARIESFGLAFGLPPAVLDTLGPAGEAMVSRATLASRSNGSYRILLATGGAIPGCRVLLSGDADPDVVAAVVRTFEAPASGWRPMPQLTQTRGMLERHAFLRRDAGGAPYLLNLMLVTDPAHRLWLFTSVAAVPPGVALPPGY